MSVLICDYSMLKFSTIRFDRFGLGDCEILDPRCVGLIQVNKGIFHSHDYLEAFFILKGTGCFEIKKNKKIITLNEGSVLYVDPNVEHMTYVSDKANEAICLNFFINRLRIPGCQPNSLISALSCSNNGYYLMDYKQDDIKSIINMINLEYEKQLSGSEYKINHLFKFLVIDSFRLLPFKNNMILDMQVDKVSKEMMWVKNYIDENYQKDITIEELANKVFLSSNWLVNSFTNTFSISPMKYLTRVRMSKAEDLLTNTDLTITEIALNIGYNNSSYFSEMFLKYNGKSPSTYRKIRQRK